MVNSVIGTKGNDMTFNFGKFKRVARKASRAKINNPEHPKLKSWLAYCAGQIALNKERATKFLRDRRFDVQVAA